MEKIKILYNKLKQANLNAECEKIINGFNSLKAEIETLEEDLKAKILESVSAGKYESVVELSSLANEIRTDASDIDTFVAEIRKGKIKVPDVEKSEEKKSVRHTRYNFIDFGIKEGDQLVFIKDNTKIAIVVSPLTNVVEYDGERYSLSSLTKVLLSQMTKREYKSSFNGYDYFLYNGKTVTDVKEEFIKKRATENAPIKIID